ncbi:alpha/beta fold hydrolase [Williamsia phyllosphaerae]|uniref:Alpha/beta hydrolase n=1 Tax=Williamsia phyllosphaerae TaxID=885042 RepID=A0ABQ1V112_9NOCA|nr:alpha/beta hydrolase [Williamsia phyllosphaerae]GGF32320.1 alpha/beta hydrolase [Williamsia phyllosphaerae]
MSPDRPQRLGILAGAAGFAALGAVAIGGVARNVTRRADARVDPNSIEDFRAIYADRASFATADDGVPLAIREVGPADAAVTVLFSHGFSLRMSSWHFQRQQLAAVWGDNVRLVFMDHRGHGRSGAAPAHTATITQLGADIDAVIRSVVPEGPVVLVGHSMGAMAIMGLATRAPELFGDRIIGVGLIATAARGITEAGLGQGLQNPLVDAFRLSVRRVPRAVRAGRGVTRAVMLPVLTAASFGSTFHSPALSQFVAAMIQNTPIDTVVDFLRSLESHDESAALAVLSRIPTLVACGYEDKVTPLPNSVELHGALKDCELVGVPDCGHLVLLERPEVITEAIERLVQRSVR